jgi:hypothetical protein
VTRDPVVTRWECAAPREGQRFRIVRQTRQTVTVLGTGQRFTLRTIYAWAPVPEPPQPDGVRST